MAGPSLPIEAEGARVSADDGSHLRDSVCQGGLFAIGVAISRVIGFLMIPVYTRLLTPVDYGILEILSLSTDILGMLAGLGIGTAVIRLYYQADTTAERHTVVSSAALLLLTVFTAVAAIGLVFAGPGALLLLGDLESTPLVRLAVVGFALSTGIELPLTYLRARQRSNALVTVLLVRTGISLALNIVFVVGMRLGVAGVLYSTIVTSLIVGGYLTAQMFRDVGARFSAAHARRLIAFGAPLIVVNLGSFALHFSDRYFLRGVSDLGEVGVYSLSYKLAMMIALMIVGPFATVWMPKALDVERREGERAGPILRRIVVSYSLVLVTGALGVALFAGDLVRIIAPAEYAAAQYPVPVLAVAMVFFGYRQSAQFGAILRHRSDLVAWATLTAAIGVLVLNALLIPRWGAMGAAWAKIAAFGSEFFLMNTLSERVHRTGIGLTTFLRPIAVGVATWLLFAWLLPEGLALVPSILAHFAAMLLFAGGLLLSGDLTRDHLAFIAQAVRNPRHALRP